MQQLLEIVRETRAWACYDCGKCTATCPIARIGDSYSPRRQVLAASQGRKQEIFDNGSLFSCLTCGLCDRRCPANVAYTDLVQKLRELSHREGIEVECPHGGALQAVMRMMAKGGAKQDRLGWLSGDLKAEPKKGEVFFWAGCTMYYDAYFADYPAKTLEGTRASVRLLNRLGVTPVVSSEERCCGHDLLWNGDRQNFEALARHNLQLVADSGAKVLVTPCAECTRTWKLDYEPYFNGKPPRIMHLTEFLAERLPELEFKANGERRVTLQDACRLGRHLNVYDAPRKLLAALPGIELSEMRRCGTAAICCAGCTWSHCDRYAKHIQVERLREARATGAEVLLTTCPKCQIHFRCAMRDPNIGDEIEIEMRDVVELVADALA